MVLYRRKSGRNRLAELKARIMGEDPAQRLMRREPITLRVLRDIPVPSWKLVFPDKLLQFRPLDGLRADLLTVAGALPMSCAFTCPHACCVLHFKVISSLCFHAPLLAVHSAFTSAQSVIMVVFIGGEGV